LADFALERLCDRERELEVAREREREPERDFDLLGSQTSLKKRLSRPSLV
jgi:hypothetical protein